MPPTGLPAHEIRFDGVALRLPDGDRPVFDGFDLTIPAGRSLAIVGQNGAGKTTLAKLLCRHVRPRRRARCCVDGVDLRELDLASWRARIAAVFQDFVRYELPLRDNVAPAGRRADDVVLAALDRRPGRATWPTLDTILSQALRGRHRPLRWPVAARRAGAGAVPRCGSAPAS